MPVLVSIRGVNEQFEIGLFLVVCKSFDFTVPRFEHFLTFKVVVVVKNSECWRELDTLE